jgi:hypothetical protein
MLPGRVGPGAGAGLRYNLHQAKEHGRKLLTLEASAKAEAFFFLHAMMARASESCSILVFTTVMGSSRHAEAKNDVNNC